MLVNLGVDHKRSSLAVLDALTLRDTEEFYRILRNAPDSRGSLILQTCNRVEFYLDTDDGEVLAEKILWHWALETRFKLGELARIVVKREGEVVVDHLVRLGSGLESMLVGEPQILGQLKNALAEANAQDAISPLLARLFEKALQAASGIREQTGIGRGAVSLGSAALKLAEETLGPIRNGRVLLIGTGQVGMLVMKALKARDIKDITVASRTRQRAESFSRTYGGTPKDLRDALGGLASMDLVVVATKATGYVLTSEMVPARGIQNKGSPLMILDLSSPRNVSPDVQGVEGVILRTIDDLRGIAEETISRRKQVVKDAEPLVRQKTEAIVSLLRRENAEPIVSDLYRRAGQIRAEELEKAFSKLKLEPDQRKVLENMSLSLVEKILGPPVVHLRKAAEKGQSEILVAAGEIFAGE